jgi:nicotinamidase-related amidase
MSSNTALIVIDVQESFRHRPYFTEEGFSGFLQRQQALIDAAKSAGLPIVQIFHVEPSGPFSEESGMVKTLQPLQIVPDVVFKKTRHSAFVGTPLSVWLVNHGISKLIISGIRTEQCCETTARHGSDLGFEIVYVTEATATFPMPDAKGRVWDIAEIAARTELVLDERFARIATVETALESI